jgi:hypothetical protein
MTNIKLNYVKGKLILHFSDLREAGQYCIKLHNYYINNYKMSDSIVVEYKQHHFLLTDDIFIISLSNLYDLFNLNALDISLMCSFAFYVRKNSLFNTLNICFTCV